jgi:hypothetical protein
MTDQSCAQESRCQLEIPTIQGENINFANTWAAASAASAAAQAINELKPGGVVLFLILPY